ncbi:membrane protein insertase YidC [Candidatus Falkowbacteria bacterium]|nr:membrane protein insertase YidC [Candidatus Falkowbacteria bacterium]
MGSIFTTIFYQPILNLLVFVYNIVPGNDIGIAIVVMTIVIKAILLPLSKKSIESQKSLQELQPKVDEVKKKYADNKEEMGRKMMELYAKHKINPLSSCLPLLIQLPFLWAVFRVFRNGLTNGSLDLVYPFISKPEALDPISFGFLNLSEPNIVLAILAGLAQFLQARMMTRKKPAVKTPGAKDEDMAAAINKQMLYFMPVLTVIIGISLPGGLTLYWLITTLLTALQQEFIFKKMNKKNDNDHEDDNKDQKDDPKVIEGEVLN